MLPINTCTPQMAGLVDGTGGAGVIDQSRWHGGGGGRCDRPIPTAEGMLSLYFFKNIY